MYARQPILCGESDRDQLYQIMAQCGPLNDETWAGWRELPGHPDDPRHAWDRTHQSVGILGMAAGWG